MKVILIKDCKDGKANTVIEVANGYGSNFLVAKGLAVPYNERTKKQLDQRLKNLVASEMELRAQAHTLKEQIEKDELNYVLDAQIDANGNLNVHNAISTKEIMKDLTKKNYKLDKYAVQKVRLVSNGTHFIEIKIYDDIIAKLKVIIKLNAK